MKSWRAPRDRGEEIPRIPALHRRLCGEYRSAPGGLILGRTPSAGIQYRWIVAERSSSPAMLGSIICDMISRSNPAATHAGS